MARVQGCSLVFRQSPGAHFLDNNYATKKAGKPRPLYFQMYVFLTYIPTLKTVFTVTVWSTGIS